MLIGLVTQIIYLIYIVAFPLISNTRAGGPAADLEILMRNFRWFAPVYTAGIFLLYYLFWQAMRLVSTDPGQASDTTRHASPFAPGADSLPSRPLNYSLKLPVLAFGLLFALTLVWLYPITANDLFRYVVRGRVWAVYGENPLVAPPDQFPDDPYLAFAGEFSHLPSVYGPLWELIIQAPLRLGAIDIVPGAISLKLLMLLCYLILALLIGWVAIPQKSSALSALTFFAWNPLILMQGLGNGHNDLVFMLLIVLGISFWQRRQWGVAALALTLATLAKAPAVLVIPLFGVVLLRNEATWRQRLLKGSGAVLIGLTTTFLVYASFGPISETLQGVSAMLTERRGFAIASELRMILREVIPRGAEASLDPASIWGVQHLRQSVPCTGADEIAGANISWPAKAVAAIVPCDVPERMPRTTARYIFLLFYAWLLVQLWRKKLNLVTAAFLAYFSQLMLGRTFRIWYPMWLIPLAALHLTPATFWRTFLFGLTAELSIINYFVVWRWWLRDLPWNKLGLLRQDYYWPIMHTLTVPWLFGIPLLGPVIISRQRQKRCRSDTSQGKKANGLTA